ncbi:hypothetical protein ACJMK2_018335 [Sinanodonta woodiana]|uniref:Serine protease K12H4.7 n=1 Tax=Sinanodonta woodiana TaxID=1069815 RepID=A0ABD3UF53_SINWO
MATTGHLQIGLLFILLSSWGTLGWIPIIFRGRPTGGMVGPPQPSGPGNASVPVELWFDLQIVDHFNAADQRIWSQRYFVNGDMYELGGPIFLMLSGEAEADPAWLQYGAWIEYAKTHNAFLILLEHRFYGKSRPLGDISLESLQFLNSRQALADVAEFIGGEFSIRDKFNLTDNKLIVFGGGYAGSLAAWFRSKYPQFVDGVVASSAPVFAEIDFKEYLAVVSDVMELSSPTCNQNVNEAIVTIWQWWGQPDKREKMFQMFQLCDHIDHDSTIETYAFFNAFAYNFEIIAQYNKVNRILQGVKEQDSKVTLEFLCDIMSDESRGPPIERYAFVNAVVLNLFSKKCLDFKFDKLITDLKRTEWTDPVAEGVRQWLYQSCTEFGWYPSTDWYDHQPFGDFFTMGFNYSCVQCAQVFGYNYFCAAETGAQETNLYYGGFYMQLTRAVFPSGSNDPWHALAFNNTKIPDTVPILIEGNSHCADMYSSTPDDSPQLKNARETINSLIGRWIS